MLANVKQLWTFPDRCRALTVCSTRMAAVQRPIDVGLVLASSAGLELLPLALEPAWCFLEVHWN